MEDLSSKQDPLKPAEHSKTKLFIFGGALVLVVLIGIILLLVLLGRNNNQLESDLVTKSKTFVETYGNYSYLDSNRKLSAIEGLITPSLYKSIEGDNQDYAYLSNLRKTKFSIETAITGPEKTEKSGSIYAISLPVNEKSTLNGLTQDDNKTYKIIWSQENNLWKITDFSTDNY